MVQRGLYATVDEAIEAAVWEMPLDDAEIDWEALREADAEAQADIDAGRLHEVTPEFIEHLRSMVRRRPA